MADEFAIEVRAQLETAIEHLAKRATFLEGRGADKRRQLGRTRAEIEAIRQLVAGHDVAVGLRVPFDCTDALVRLSLWEDCR